jgi:3-isopropylmalate dehydrogenase
MIESSRMMIEWLGHNRDIPQALAAAALVSKGIDKALSDPKTRTSDINGTGNTRTMTQNIIASF